MNRYVIENNDVEIKKVLKDLRIQLMQFCPDKKRNVSAAVLAAEEILLMYRDKIEEFKASVEIKKDVHNLSVCIIIPGKRYPLEEIVSEDEISILDNIIKNSNLEVNYDYNNNCNCIELIIEKYSSIKDNLLFSFKYLGSNKRYYIRGVFAQVISMIANLCIPAITAKMIVVFTENEFTRVIATTGSILIANVIYHVSLSIANINYNKVDYRIRKNLGIDLVNSVLSVKEECFDENGTGPFINRINDDIPIVSEGIETIFSMISQMTYYVGVFAATLIIDYRIFICEVVTVIILSVIENIRGNNLDEDSRAVYEAEERSSGLIVDIISGERDIKILDGGRFFYKKMEKLAATTAERSEHRVIRNQTAVIVSSCITYLCQFITMILLGYYLKTGRNTLPDTLVLFNYFTLIGTPFIHTVQRCVDFIKTFNLSTERVRNLLDGNEFPRESFGTVHLDEVKGKIKLENVTFAYNHHNILEEDKNIIKNISLQIDPGSKVAFVGKSGSGKTTLFNLISHQRNCSSGRILIDDVDIEDLDKPTIRHNMMIVPQSPYLFNASVKDNLLIAKPDATMDELKRVCEMACIRDEIEQMKDGFDTLLGERGVRMSGGQRQRLAIARGFLTGTKIILLDEATSAIDNLTQARIKNTIYNLNGDYTVIMIAHRLSTIIDADRIIFIDNGCVTAQGTHGELIENCRKYRELYQAET